MTTASLGPLSHPSITEPRPATLSVSVVIPAKNEARNISWVLQRIPAFVDEVILVDGLSRDQTEAVARMVRPDIRVIHDTRPGKGRALRTGFAAARGDIIVMLDADCSMDPAEMHGFVELVAAGKDFVKGSRFLPGGGTDDMTLIRKVGNAGLMMLVNLMYGSRFTDLCYGYCAFRRELLDRVSLDVDGFDIEMQLIGRMYLSGVEIVEAPSFEAPRNYGQSNLRTFRDGWRILFTMMAELRNRRSLVGASPQRSTPQ